MGIAVVEPLRQAYRLAALPGEVAFHLQSTAAARKHIDAENRQPSIHPCTHAITSVYYRSHAYSACPLWDDSLSVMPCGFTTSGIGLQLQVVADWTAV